MAKNIKKEQKNSVSLGYLNKDFNSFQRDIRNFAKNHLFRIKNENPRTLINEDW